MFSSLFYINVRNVRGVKNKIIRFIRIVPGSGLLGKFATVYFLIKQNHLSAP